MTLGQALRSYKRAQLAAEKAQEKVDDLRRQLAVNCHHPSEYVTEFRWEHDNGYGRQSWIKGLLCTICRKVDLWKSGHFIDRDRTSI